MDALKKERLSEFTTLARLLRDSDMYVLDCDVIASTVGLTLILESFGNSLNAPTVNKGTALNHSRLLLLGFMWLSGFLWIREIYDLKIHC